VRPLLRRLCVAFIGAAFLFSPVTASAKKPKTVTQAPVTAGSLQLFASEAGAQAHCPRDQVVWLNTNSGIYHEKGMRWYGNTKAGAYVCRREADAAGDRDTRNGQ
jgi:di/tricarboxylate transporter